MSLRHRIVDLLQWLVPQSCVSCDRYGTEGHDLCAACADKILFGEGAMTCDADPTVAARLLNLSTELFLDGFEAVTVFAPPISDYIKIMKYDFVERMAAPLGEWLWWWGQVPWPVDYICHVPLHQRRYIERGFNQAQIMAAKYAQLSNWPHLPLLERCQKTVNQAVANLAQRQTQLQGIFRVRDKFLTPTAAATLAHKNILIIDDVITTGNTFNECARALKNELSVNKVYALAFAHE